MTVRARHSGVPLLPDTFDGPDPLRTLISLTIKGRDLELYYRPGNKDAAQRAMQRLMNDCWPNPIPDGDYTYWAGDWFMFTGLYN